MKKITNKLFAFWQENATGETAEVLKKMTHKEIEKYFAKELSFGTAGVRAKMGVGTNRLNYLTIGKVVAGIAGFALKHSKTPKILIARDTRQNSKEYAELSANILSHFGIKTVLFAEPTPTPVLTYNVLKNKFDFGIVITASHNVKEYNGVKIIDSTASQLSDKQCQEIEKYMHKCNEFEISKISRQKIKYAPKSYKNNYLKFANSVANSKQQKQIKICYTPLNGTGLSYVEYLLKKHKYNFTVPPKQISQDGVFATCPYPNPEMLEVYNECIKLCKQYQADIIIANDPDADRMGVMAKQGKTYKKLTGNQVALLLADYIFKNKKTDKGYMITTVVSTMLAKKLAQHYGVEYYETLTGFKNMATLSQMLSGKQLFMFEEACGYEVSGKLKDKDGITALLLVCEIANNLKLENKTLFDALEEIYKKVGYEETFTQSILFDGAQAKLDYFVEKVRNEDISGLKFEKKIDYLDSKKTKLQKSNFIKYIGNGYNLIIRPSGTEPKLKIYALAHSNTHESCLERLEELKKVIYSYFVL